MQEVAGVDYSFGHCVVADLKRYRVIAKGPLAGNSLRLRDWLILISPRFAPMLLQRMAYALQKSRLSPLARLVSLVNFLAFGIEISARCPIGEGLFFPHTQGTVIGAWCIGKNATIYQGVTVGAKELDFDYSARSRPRIGDGVIIGSGAKVLGGIEVGSAARIGANTVVTKSLPTNVLAVCAPVRLLLENSAEQTI